MSITVQEAIQRFLEEEDEVVTRLRFERIAKALSAFLEYLSGAGVTEIPSLKCEHLEEYLLVAFPAGEVTATDASDTWHSIQRFVKWLSRKHHSKLYGDFARKKAYLREGFKALSSRG